MKNIILLVMTSLFFISCSTPVKKNNDYTEIVKNTLIENISSIRSCYRDELKIAEGEFTLTVKLDFTVNRAGETVFVETRSLNPHDERKKKVCDCISAIVSKMTLPKPEKRVAVSQSFQFRPELLK